MPPKHRAPRAFSLIELLAVIAIGAILVALGANMMKNVGAPNPGNVARQVSSMIQLASSESRAKSMPVWMGIADLKEGQDHNLVLLTVTAEPDANGVPDFATSLKPLGKAERFGSVTVPNSYDSEQTANPSRGAATPIADVTNTAYEIPFKIAGKDVTFKQVLEFSPSGSISMPGVDAPMIEIYIQPMRGDVKAPGKNTAVVQIQGLTGTCRVVQP